MSKVTPFHSVKENHHHDNNKCGPGSEIPAHNKQQVLETSLFARTAKGWTTLVSNLHRINVISQ